MAHGRSVVVLISRNEDTRRGGRLSHWTETPYGRCGPGAISGVSSANWTLGSCGPRARPTSCLRVNQDLLQKQAIGAQLNYVDDD